MIKERKRFLLQSDVVVIPKSPHKERMEQNLDVFVFTLSQEAMEMIRGWMKGKACSSPTMTPLLWR